MTATTTRTDIEVLPSSGHTGAEVRGVNLAETLDDVTVNAIRQALLRWKVIFFRGQSIGHAEQVAFTARFGKVTPAHPHEDETPAGFPQILPLDSRQFKKKFGDRDVAYDNGWHTDVTPLVNPPWGSVLRADVVPPYGGDTAWTNLVAAYEGLPLPLRELADKLRAKHSFGQIAQASANGGSVAQAVAARPLVAIHPLVRVHPETGERALYVSPSFTSHDREIIGMSRRHSQQLLEMFWEHIARPQYTVRFRWEPGSVAFWDNRSTAHLAATDLGHLDFDRVMYRTTLEGDVPVGPDGEMSEAVIGEPFLGS